MTFFRYLRKKCKSLYIQAKDPKKNTSQNFSDVNLLSETLNELAYVQERASEIEKQRHYYDAFEDAPSMTLQYSDRDVLESQPEIVDRAVRNLTFTDGQPISREDGFNTIDEPFLPAESSHRNSEVKASPLQTQEGDDKFPIADDFDQAIDAWDDFEECTLGSLDTAHDESINEGDWELFDPELPEYSEAPSSEEFIQIDIESHLTRQERALQEATMLGHRYGWDRTGIELLAEVFEIYWWSAARRAMERELEAGLQPQELFLALETRKIWEDHGEYWQSQSRRHLYSTLSWPLSLAIVRSFIGYPDMSEIEAFLWNAYSFWEANPRLMRSYTSFYFYVKAKVSFPHKNILVNPIVSMGDRYDPRDDGFLGGAYVLYDLLPNELFEEYG